MHFATLAYISSTSPHSQALVSCSQTVPFVWESIVMQDIYTKNSLAGVAICSGYPQPNLGGRGMCMRLAMIRTLAPSTHCCFQHNHRRKLLIVSVYVTTGKKYRLKITFIDLCLQIKFNGYCYIKRALKVWAWKSSDILKYVVCIR